ncbi:ImmA/IrrE family metallo-endopeptidase [Amycolatopsis acidicola]|uniref:ImmA/IrrE family metallo-endopeptidase n=1 Tax=Amycolatopsis acidicola TaxID=2596893 RepID=UPI001FB589DB|nr:ImmA/IrrE family metallo-endopeptidase [Amycolatopsis acidicola]
MTESARNSALQWARLIAEKFEELSGGNTLFPVGLRQLYGANPRDAAQEVRSWLGFNSDEPIHSLILDVEKVGVTVIGLPIVESNIDAFCAWREGVPTICLLDGVPGDRLRFTAAHELGHLVLHDGQRSGQEVEREADAFAAELLTPINSIKNEFPSKITLSTLTMMKTSWGVSLRTLIRRARELNLIDQDRAVGLYRQISARGWNRAEPGHVPVEKPRAFRKMAEMRYGPGPNIPLLATEAAWSEELASNIVDRHAKASELPFVGPSFTRVKGENVVDFQARRAARSG